MNGETLVLIVGCCLVTYAMRGPAMLLFARMAVPDFVRQALPFVPICVLVAITAPALLAPAGSLELRPWLNAWLVAGAAAGLVAAWRKDLVSPVLAGLAAFWLHQAIVTVS
jgi:branched-subunit amino acid transport protein